MASPALVIRGAWSYGARSPLDGPTVLLFLIACTPTGPAGITEALHTTATSPDVVLITLDTVRADRLGAYGYTKARTATIDRLAREGVVFQSALAPVPLTIPSHATMHSGLYPWHHGIRANGDNVLSPEITTLAEQLRSHGYRTAASVAAFVTTRQWGFNQGFDNYMDFLGDESAPDRNFWHLERDGAAVVDDAVQWLAEQPGTNPVFLWVHLYDAHAPYVTHPTTPPELLPNPYDAEIAYLDAQVERLVTAMAGRPVLWVLVGDHGESLGEHGERTHGLFAYQSTQHVPWIMSGVGLPAGVVEHPVTTADVTPTILGALGKSVPEGLDGRHQPGQVRPVYAESYQTSDRFLVAPHRVLVEGNLKLINTPTPELYDLGADPGEQNDLAGTRAGDVQRLQGAFTQLGVTHPKAGGASLDAETVSQLAELGYMSGSAGDIDYDALPDHKQYPSLWTALAQIDEGVGPERTLSLLRELVILKPDAFELWTRQFMALTRLGRVEEARMTASTTAARFPNRGRPWVTLASLALEDQDPTTALVYARQAYAAEPADSGAQEMLVRVLGMNDLGPELEALGTELLAKSTSAYGVAAELGTYYMTKGEYAKAEQMFRRALAAPNPKRGAREQLAWLALLTDHREDAHRLLESELKDYPTNSRARLVLARALQEELRFLDELAHRQFLVKARPRNPEFLRALAQCNFNLQDYKSARRAIEAGLSLAPDDPETVLLYANLLMKEGRPEEGAATFRRASALHDAELAAAGLEPERAAETALDGPVATPGAASPPPATPGAGARSPAPPAGTP